MLKTHKLCPVCTALKTNAVLLNKIYGTSFFVRGGPSLRQLQEEYSDKFSYNSLTNHVKKHQFIDQEDFTQRHLKGIVRKAEADITRKNIASKAVWDEVLDQGMEQLQGKNMTLGVNALLKAAKDKSEYELKQKDQELAMMDMVMHFASGEDTNSKAYDRRIIEGKAVTDFDPTEGTPGNLKPGTDGPGHIHYPPAWDAPPSGSSEVPESSSER